MRRISSVARSSLSIVFTTGTGRIIGASTAMGLPPLPSAQTLTDNDGDGVHAEQRHEQDDDRRGRQITELLMRPACPLIDLHRHRRVLAEKSVGSVRKVRGR